FLGRRSLVDSAFEGDRERVQRWLPPRRPACPAPTRRVKRAGHEIETLQRCSIVGEVSTGSDRAAVARVEGLDRVRRADDPADLDVPVEERHELGPGVLPELRDCWILPTPLRVELLEPLTSGRFSRSRIDRPEVLAHLFPVVA